MSHFCIFSQIRPFFKVSSRRFLPFIPPPMPLPLCFSETSGSDCQPTVKVCSSRSSAGCTGRSTISNSIGVGMQQRCSHADGRVCARASGVCRCSSESSTLMSNNTIVGCGSDFIWRRGLTRAYFMQQQSSSFCHFEKGSTFILPYRCGVVFITGTLPPSYQTVAAPLIFYYGE